MRRDCGCFRGEAAAAALRAVREGERSERERGRVVVGEREREGGVKADGPGSTEPETGPVAEGIRVARRGPWASCFQTPPPRLARCGCQAVLSMTNGSAIRGTTCLWEKRRLAVLGWGFRVHLSAKVGEGQWKRARARKRRGARQSVTGRDGGGIVSAGEPCGLPCGSASWAILHCGLLYVQGLYCTVPGWAGSRRGCDCGAASGGGGVGGGDWRAAAA